MQCRFRYKKFLSQRCDYTPNFFLKVGLMSNFKIEFSLLSSHIFAILTSKVKSLNPKTPMQQFSDIRLLQERNYSTIFKNQIFKILKFQNLPPLAKIKVTITLKPLEILGKKFFIIFNNFSVKNKFLLYKKYAYKKL